MTNNPAHLPGNHDAEGSPGTHERREPVDLMRTSLMPSVLVPVLNNEEDSLMEHTDSDDHPEESDDQSETQDATLTSDETRKSDTASTVSPTRPDTKSEPEMPTTPVLIVEDTVELAEVIQATLETMDMKAMYTTHGKIGLERLKEHEPCLVIMDIGLPDITGWKMLDSIKRYYDENPEKTVPPIIVITAYGDPANRLIGKLQNIHSYLLKPFTPDHVERLVKMALAGEKPDDPFVDNHR